MSKIVALVSGAIVTLIVVIMILIFGSRVSTPSATLENQPTISAQQVQSGVQKVQSAGLENFGNLPIIITGDQIGRSNPFEAY